MPLLAELARASVWAGGQEGILRVTTHGYSMLFFSELVFMVFTLVTTLYISVPHPTAAQNFQAALLLVPDTHTHTHTHTRTHTHTHRPPPPHRTSRPPSWCRRETERQREGEGAGGREGGRE